MFFHTKRETRGLPRPLCSGLGNGRPPRTFVFYIEFVRIEKEGDPEEVGNDAYIFIYVHLVICLLVGPSVRAFVYSEVPRRRDLGGASMSFIS